MRLFLEIKLASSIDFFYHLLCAILTYISMSCSSEIRIAIVQRIEDVSR